jgi:hypothetical protein
MTTHKLDHRGFITTGPVDGTSIAVLDGHVSFSNPPTIPSKYQFIKDQASKTFTGTFVYFNFTFTGSNTYEDSGTSWYNTSSHVFFPASLGKVYSMRIDGIMSSSSGNPIFHMDFEQTGIITSGTTLDSSFQYSPNRQSHDFDVVRGGLGHSHFHMTFLVLATQDLVTSGGQFYCATNGNQVVSFTSATLLIVEH